MLRFFSTFRRQTSSPLWQKIQQIRQSKTPLTVADRNDVYTQIERGLNGLSEKHLSLTLSVVLDTRNIPSKSEVRFPAVVTSLVEAIIKSGTTLQGCNQILGSFAKLKTNGVIVDSYLGVCESVFDEFSSKFLHSCPNRELSNIFWAACVLGLTGGVDILGKRGVAIPQLLASMDCVDISLICAGLMDRPQENTLWSLVLSDLKSRLNFTSKDIPSIMCSIACAGISDTDLMTHLVGKILADNLLTWKNAPGIVWAISTCDFVHFPLLNEVENVLNRAPRHAEWSALDLRRLSRAYAVSGKLNQIDDWLLAKVLSMRENASDKTIADSVLVWEYAVNGLYESALKLFRSRPIAYWKGEVERAPVAASQLYSLYLVSFGEKEKLSSFELEYLLSLQSSFADPMDNMSSSILHRQASDALADLNIEHVSEYKEPVSGFVVDMFVPSRNIAIEVQGPSHYLTDLVSGKAVLRPSDKLKHRVLVHVANMQVVQITPWNFGPKIRINNRVLMKRLMEGTDRRSVPPPPRKRLVGENNY
jgi:hypothetical protein